MIDNCLGVTTIRLGITGVIDNCLGVTTIRLGITGVGHLSAIVAASAVTGIEAVSIVMALLRVVENKQLQSCL